MSPGTAQNEGFTLIEVLVSFAILAGAIIMAFQVFGDGLHALHAGQSRAQEIELAQLQIEKLSLSQQLQESTSNVVVGTIKLRLVIAELKKEQQQTVTFLHTFRVSVFRDDTSQHPEPLLETVLIAKSGAP